MPKKRMSKVESEGALLSLFTDLVENGDLKAFLEHIQFDRSTVPTGATPEQFFEAFKQHYTRRGRIDDDQVAKDLLLYPPVAAKIVEMQMADDEAAAGKS